MKNKLTEWLQNRTVLAALLLVLAGATAIAGVAAMRKDGKESEKEDPAYVMETQGLQEDSPLLEESKGKEEEVPADAQQVEALLPEENAQVIETEKKPIKNQGAKTPSLNEKTEDLIPDIEEIIEGENLQPEEKIAEELPVNAESAGIYFPSQGILSWPVEGRVLLGYSMDTTTYFATLKQYKCNPGLLLQAEPGTKILAGAAGFVEAIGYDEEIGNYVMMDLGGGYELIYGQLEEVNVSLHQVVAQGEEIGSLANPTKYYVVEGPNLYLELRCQQTPMDPLDYLQ